MTKPRRPVMAIVVVGFLAAAEATCGLQEWAGAQQPFANSDVPQPTSGDEEPRRTEPMDRDTADIRGSWEVVYVSGMVSGKREGYVLPGLIVHITDKTIDLPTLTSRAKAPVKTVGALRYTLEPGRKDADEQVALAEQELQQLRVALRGTERSVLTKRLPEASLIMAKKKVDYAEDVLRIARRRRDERIVRTNAQESRINIEGAAQNEKTRRGIYKRTFDLLSICYDASGDGRPETFAANRPSETFVIMRKGAAKQMLAVPQSKGPLTESPQAPTSENRDK